MTGRGRRGGSLLEFALIFPVFMGMFLGLIDSGSFLWQRLAMEFAIQAGCRAGTMVDPGVGAVDADSVYSRVNAAIPYALTRYGVECGDCDPAAAIVTDATTGVSSLECSMTRTTTTLTGMIPAIPISGTILMRMEYQR